MSTDTLDNVERSVVLWHLQACMATFYTQLLPKESNKRKPYQSVQFTDTIRCSHENLNLFTIAAPIRYFDHLTTLHLDDNQLTWLPRELWQLASLQKLNLGRNALTELPAGLGLLVGLKELYVHENQLVTLPSQIGQLRDLRVLDVTNNKAMTVLPWEITLLASSLRRLWIDGTGLVTTTTATKATTTTTTSSIPSLFHLCAQLAGSSPCVPIPTIDGVPLSLLSSLMADMDPTNNNNDDDADSSVMRRCSLCQTVLYYPGIPLLDPHGDLAGQTLPLLYYVCSQTCRSRWLAGMKQGTS